ncbi:hypothetical protein HAX54_034956 [Datura stramonium]|uniref:Uncharacterized protein n=1 Tax=Datura stramonium TaxID=4076 RepID=A0ABS8VEQ7_DATST|nr:hypothetical protein [Datura stramonium]
MGPRHGPSQDLVGIYHQASNHIECIEGACGECARQGTQSGARDRDQGQWRNRDAPKNDRNGVYVPPRSRQPAMNESRTARLEDMMSRIMKKVDSTEELSHKPQFLSVNAKNGVHKNLDLQCIWQHGAQAL